MTNAKPIKCPCCGGLMTFDLVTCWPCYGLSNRLTAGTWAMQSGVRREITVEAINVWASARDLRVSK